jgi:dimethylhistidine N-methyltransferase
MGSRGFSAPNRDAAAGARLTGLATPPVVLGDTVAAASLRIVQHNLPDAASELRELQSSLLSPEARIPSKYFYDDTGCALFANICRLPEYYLTRTEATIFARHGRQIAACLPQGAQWFDLGCADGRKSYPWLEAIAARRFIGVDFARDGLVQAIDNAGRSFRDIECLGVVTDLSLPLELQSILAERPTWPPVFFYPGSSLGNFTSATAVALLTTIREHLDDGGALLIGVDLVKDTAILEAAYDDDQGVTAAFNRNILRVVNRLVDADFDPDEFEHCAQFTAEASRIELRLRARQPQTVRIGRQMRHFAAGEPILTEYSHKYSVDGFIAMLDAAGFSRHHAWTDERGWFGVFLALP